VVGLHSGSKVGAALAAGSPGRVASFTLMRMTHRIIVEAERRNAAMSVYLRNKPTVDPAADPEAWRDEQLDPWQSRGVKDLYAANYAFDLTAALRGIASRCLVIELAVAQEESLGRQAPAMTALMSDACAVAWQGNERELLQQRPAELAAILADFLSPTPHPAT
jgi:hypothetical protein